MHYDVFNGDADGIIALLQLRFAQPKESTLITGVKRDIQLLEQVVARGDASSVTVLDVSMEKNYSALVTLMEQNVDVFYCDHHRSGEIPRSSHLEAIINLDAQTCTSLLINQKLRGQYINWAIVAAFGDNLNERAESLAKSKGLSDTDTEFLKELGVLINYNGYGSSLTDLHIEPANLYRALTQYKNPFELREDTDSPYYKLKLGYQQDYAQVETLAPVVTTASSRVFELPCESWARRISGVFGNELANQAPQLAHAVLTLNKSQDDYTVSVRAPLNNRVGADEVCIQFQTGGGRKAAAGINKLPVSEKQRFFDTLHQFYI